MSKLMRFAEGGVAAVLAIAGTSIVNTERNEESKNSYCIVHQDICPKVRNAVDWACSIANNDNYGYSFGNVRSGEYDCSGLVIQAYRNAGIDTGGATYTGNMYSELTSHGFVAYDYNDKIEELMVGDILLTEDHTEMYIGDGKNVGAHWDFDGIAGDSSHEEIDYGDFNEYTNKWDCILRYVPKWSDWFSSPELNDNFYAFIEQGSSVLSSNNGSLLLETETGDKQQIWHFTKEDNGCYNISSESYSERFNLYQDDTEAIIFSRGDSDNICLTNKYNSVQENTYNSCSDEQRFKIRPIDSIKVMYDYGGKKCPIRDENYNEPYSCAFDLVITGFIGWYDSPKGGNKIDPSKVSIPYDHTIYAHFDSNKIETTTKAEEPTTVVTTEEATNLVVVEEVTTNNEMFHRTENKPIQVESLSLNRYSKTLNTVGNSTSFTLKAEAYPTNATDKSIRYESSNSGIARVDSNTGCIYAVSDGTCSIKAIANNGVSASCEITVSTQYTTLTEKIPIPKTETVVDSYEMECYVGRTVEGKIRQFFSYDISSQYDELGLSRVYGMWHHVHTFPASQVDSAPRIYNGMHQGGSQDGANACKDVGYSLLYGQGDEYYIFFVKNINYKTAETVSYQTNTTRIPVEYA